MSDHRTLLAGTAANVIGLAAGVLAAFGVQVLLGRSLPAGGLGVVTVAVQIAFVAAAGGRFGMDMTAIRRVAMAEGGTGDRASMRSLVERAAAIGAAASVALAIVVAAGAELVGVYSTPVAIGAVSIPLMAVATIYLGATRGLKSMKPTLWIYWIGQPVAWIGIAGAAIAAGGGIDAAVAAYAVSWGLATVAARIWWRAMSAGMGDARASRAQVADAVRYGLPRAPSALLAQALFWGDLFVLGHYVQGRELDSYAAAGRISQVLLLFLTSVSLIFSPFAADLHARGEIDHLNRLFKDATRWALAATLPVLVVLFVAAPQALDAFGPTYGSGVRPLRIMLAGQLVNVATGSVAYVLVMIGRTGLDLVDNLLANFVLIGGAAVLASAYGPTGAAIASAVALSGVNVVRVVQVRQVASIHPFSRSQLRLALPTGGCVAAALAVHVLMSGSTWWASLALTTLAAGAAYCLLLFPGLPAHERRAVRGRLRPVDRQAP